MLQCMVCNSAYEPCMHTSAKNTPTGTPSLIENSTACPLCRSVAAPNSNAHNTRCRWRRYVSDYYAEYCTLRMSMRQLPPQHLPHLVVPPGLQVRHARAWGRSVFSSGQVQRSLDRGDSQGSCQGAVQLRQHPRRCAGSLTEPTKRQSVCAARAMWLATRGTNLPGCLSSAWCCLPLTLALQLPRHVVCAGH